MDQVNTLFLNQHRSTTEKISDSIRRHPFLLTAALCLSCITIGGRSKPSLIGLILPSALTAIGIVFLTMQAVRFMQKDMRRIITRASVPVGVILGIAFGLWLNKCDHIEMPILNFGLAVCIPTVVCLLLSKARNSADICMILMLCGFLLRLAFVLRFEHIHYQHDAGSAADMDGHLGYIAYFLENHHIPDFDVRDVYQFYHPPLHHIIAALWIAIQQFIGIPLSDAYENIQLLTLFYSSASMIICYRILRVLGLRGRGLIAASAIICFCPTFIFMAGSINNDMLSITLALGALLNSLYWYRSRSFGRMICTALCIGLSMMAKLSGWMAASAIAVLFFGAFFSDLKNWKKYLLQFTVFLFISVPLAIWWEIRNLISYGVPITYVMRLSEKSKQYIGSVPTFRRLFDFSPYQFDNPGIQFVFYDGEYNEFNPLMGLFKTSISDELFVSSRFSSVAGWDKLILIVTMLLGAAGVAAMIFCFTRASKMKLIYKLFSGAVYFTYLIMYYVFCLTYPHVCTQNIRYAVPLIVMGAFFTGYATMCLSRSGRKKKLSAPYIISWALIGISSAYCILSLCYYELIYVR